MLSFLNASIGFAAFFALLSLLVTTTIQLIRTGLGFGSRRLADTLLRLFGEIEDPNRFVAAILAHPSLTGPKGHGKYSKLVDPATDPKEAKALAVEVIDAHRRVGPRGAFHRAWGSWPTADLDKQTVKDIASTIYARIGAVVDPFPSSDSDIDAAVVDRWGAKLKDALKAAPAAGPAATAGSKPAEGPPTIVPHYGRLWLLATAAFPEGEGRANAVKTYIAAFFDESVASASDALTLRIRRYTAGVALVLALALQIDAISLWNRFAGMDPRAVDRFARSVNALNSAQAAGSTQSPGSTDLAKKLQDQAKALSLAPLDLSWDRATWGNPWQHAFGIILAWMALALGAPFWFQILRSAIDMKSAFSSSDDKKK
jgi:hypothetical protein